MTSHQQHLSTKNDSHRSDVNVDDADGGNQKLQLEIPSDEGAVKADVTHYHHGS